MRVHRNVLLLAAAMFPYAFCAGYFAWFLPLHISRVGGEALMSLYFSVIRPILWVAVPVCGILSDVVGRKPMISASFLSFIAGIGLLVFTRESPILLLPSIALLAFVQPLQGGALLAMLAESVDERMRGRVMSLFPVVGLVGSASGSTALGLLANTAGLDTALAVALVLAFASLVSSLLLVETGTKTRTTGLKAALRNPFAGIKSLFLDRSLYPLALMAVLWGISSKMFGLYLPLYLSRYAGFDMAQIGLLFSSVAVAQAVGQPVSGWFVDKYGCIKALLLNELGSGILVLIFVAVTTAGGHSSTALMVFPMLMLSSSLSAFGNTAYQVHVAKVTSPGTRATVYSAIDSISMLSQSVSPALGYALWTIRPQLVYIACSATAFSCVPLILMLRGGQDHVKEK